ncbi:MAG: glycosyl transferase [Ardenticatenales bacterium]|nr:glycosyl transferase [Ardenticatenales bacterium]
MSKIVYLNVPAHGHINPTLPVVEELVQRGEQVLYYNTEEFRPQIERTGATFRAYPETTLTSTTLADAIHDGNLVNVSVLLLRATEALLPFLLDDLAREAPDLVLFDSTALWGKMACNILSLRDASSISTLVLDLPSAAMSPREMLGLLRQALPKVPAILAGRFRLVRRYGPASFPPGDVFPVRGGLSLVFTAREFQPDTPLIDETFRFVGPSINLQTRGEPFPFDEVTQHPVIYISMGTIHQAQMDFCQQCFEAFGNMAAQVIFSVGKHTQIEQLGPIPANFIVRPSVPQLEVLQRADAFITHGGINSVHEGLYYGVPLVLIPHHIEQLFNARCTKAQGAGIIIDAQMKGRRILAAALRAAVDILLSEPSYRAGAVKVQQMLRATGGYKQAADEIQHYLAQRVANP